VHEKCKLITVWHSHNQKTM